jgi:hypothetical protein
MVGGWVGGGGRMGEVLCVGWGGWLGFHGGGGGSTVGAAGGSCGRDPGAAGGDAASS